jgi:hypothetical protein
MLEAASAAELEPELDVLALCARLEALELPEVGSFVTEMLMWGLFSLNLVRS